MHVKRHVAPLLVAAAVGLAPLVGSGCTAEKPTEIMTGVLTQVQVPRDLKAVRITVAGSSGQIVFSQYYRVHDGSVRLPGTMGFIPGSSRRITVSVVGFPLTDQQLIDEGYRNDETRDSQGSDKEVRVLRRAVTSYIDNRVLYLPMPIRYPCLDRGTCPDTSDGKRQTCRAGACVPADVLAETLRDFSTSFVDGDTNTCFNASLCMAASVPVAPLLPPELTAGGGCTGDTTRPCFPDLPTEPICTFDIGPQLAEIKKRLSAEDYQRYQDPQRLNVRVVYGNFPEIEPGDTLARADLPRAEILDFDPEEGFYVPDPLNKPSQIALGNLLCGAQKEWYAAWSVARRATPPGPRPPGHPIVGVVASPGLCPSKTAFQPFCNDDRRLSTGQYQDQFVPQPEVCVDTRQLEPAPSALYVLMDRSYAMRHFFGPQKVKTVLELSLDDPVFQNAQVGSRFYPATPADCGATNPFSAIPVGVGGSPLDPLTVPFALARDARLSIARLLERDGSSALLSPATYLADPVAGNPTVYLDAVLGPNGAYKALRDLQAGTATQFNRLAVVVIGNREFERSSCSPAGPSPAQLAFQARNPTLAGVPPIYTYAVLLPHDTKTPPLPTDAAGNGALAQAARDVATAGGTSVFDASRDPQVGATAINSIVADLGSCLYDPPRATPPITDIRSYVRPDGVLSYFDPIQFKRVDLRQNLACTATAAGGQTTSGWNYDGGRVRICGAACDDIRTALKTSAALAEQQLQSPPGLSIRLQQPCGAPSTSPSGPDGG